MPDTTRLVVSFLEVVRDGRELHHDALRAMHAERFERAELLFEAALRHYRRHVQVQGIARARVHQLMARVRSGAEPAREMEFCLEVERRLCQLEHIESLASPFQLVEAGTLIANWRNGGTAEHEPEQPAAAAAAMPEGLARAA